MLFLSLLTGCLFYLSGFESILEGVYGPMLLRELNLFNGGLLPTFFFKHDCILLIWFFLPEQFASISLNAF